MRRTLSLRRFLNNGLGQLRGLRMGTAGIGRLVVVVALAMMVEASAVVERLTTVFVGAHIWRLAGAMKSLDDRLKQVKCVAKTHCLARICVCKVHLAANRLPQPGQVHGC